MDEPADAFSSKKQFGEDNMADHLSCRSVGFTVRWQILAKSETQDALGFDTLGRARDIVKRTGAERRHVGIPVSQVGKDNHGNAPCGRRQDLQRSSEIAIRQIIIAKDKLKCLPPKQNSGFGK